MKLGASLRLLILAGFLAVAAGCGSTTSSDQPVPQTVDLTVAPPQVLLLTNPVGANAVREYRRDNNTGALTFVADYPTGGQGSGDGLNGSTNAVFLDRVNSLLYAVNAGNNTVSAMRLNADGSLTQLSTVASGGTRPISVTAFGDLVYVLNFGNPATPVAANITGFRLVGNNLVPIAGSTQALSAANPNPAQIGFNTVGNVLIVTERATNMISTFTLTGGVANAVNAQASAGTTPFGFDFSPNGLMVVSQANGGAAGGSSCTSYSINNAGVITPVSPNVTNAQTGACWVDVAGGGRFAFVTNTGSNTVSTYQIAGTGALTVTGGGASGATGAAPVDLGVSNDGRFLYTLNATAETISTFSLNADGSMAIQAAAGAAGLPAASVGIIVR